MHQSIESTLKCTFLLSIDHPIIIFSYTRYKEGMDWRLYTAGQSKMTVEQLPKILENAVRLGYSKEDYIMLLLLNSLETSGAVIITQLHNKSSQKLGKLKQEHRAFIGCKLVGLKEHWFSFEEETYAIVETFDRMDYWLCRTLPLHTFINYLNLFDVFAPLSLRLQSPSCILQSPDMGDTALPIRLRGRSYQRKYGLFCRNTQ